MTAHSFKLGDLVRLRSAATTLADEGALDVINIKHEPHIYEVVLLLPDFASGEPQYRIWHPDGQEHVVRESQLDAVQHPQPRR